uniref:Peptidase n=1 Tax=Pseudomonas phage HRDY3 TaxID=3236930 RepID=A0AB39CEA5_9VIRU
MAALEALNEIVDKHSSDQEKKEPVQRRTARESAPRLMQHAHVPQNDGVTFTGQRKHSYAKTGPRNNQQQQKSNLPAVRTQTGGQHDRQADAIEGQTQVIRSQAMASQKQSNLLQQQSGLMQDQLQATQEMSDVMNRLATYMQKQMNKLEPKVQHTGNTYEGEFTRINDKQMQAQERRMTVLDEIREKRREMQRARAAKQERDRLGRFTRSAPQKIGPKMQRVGGMGGQLGGMMEGMGGRAAGMAARAAGPLLALAAAYYGTKALTAASDNYTFEKKDSNMVTRGWQNTKDWVGDKFRSDPGESFLDQASAKSGAKQQGELMGETARHKDFGSISAAFESGGKGVGTVSTGKGDNGGVSYGKHQLSSKAGTMTAFLRSEDGQKYYNDFRGMAPGSEEFNKKYKEVAERDGEGFDKAQQAFTTKSHYNPVAAWFEKQYDIKLDERSRALKEAIYSVAVQYGTGTAKSVLGDAFGNRDITKMGDAELIDRLQETRAATVSTRFRSSSQDVQDGVYKRAGTEKAALLKMLNEEQGGPGSAKASGSGIGSQYSQQMIGAYGGKPSGANQSGTASNGTVGVMAMPQGGGGSPSGAGDEAGGGTAAAMLSPADGALYALGQKHVRPNDTSVNMSGLNDKFKQAFFTMVGDWVQNHSGTMVNVASAFRTRAEQEKLWIKYGRNTKRVARPGTSRHESGFAIDIDRNSASAMEGAGLFKKYGFHRPLSNEPWHVEMVGAGKGGAGGGPQVAAANASPQLMQQAASQEMDKAAETTVKRAEENTKGAEKTWSQKLNEKGGKPPTDSETGGTSKAAEANGAKAKAGLEEEEEEEEVDEKKMILVKTTPKSSTKK